MILSQRGNYGCEMQLWVLVVSKRLPAVAKRHDWAALRELCVGVG
jgi:hypothetical protein